MDRIYSILCFGLVFWTEEDLLWAVRSRGLKILWTESRLLSLEFLLLYWPAFCCTIGVVLPPMVDEMRAHCLKTPSCSRFVWEQPPLVPWGTNPEGTGQLLDCGDIQLRAFRGGLPLLLLAATGLTGLVRAIGLLCKNHRNYGTIMVYVRLFVGLAFVLFIHGSGLAFLLAVSFLFFQTSKKLAGSPLAVPCTWILAILVIALKEPRWPFRRHLYFSTVFGAYGAKIDKFSGEYDWSSSANLLVLRLVSFCLDQHKAVLNKKAGKGSDGQSIDVSTGYSFVGCCCHGLYAPLWLAGPTICYNDFMSQCLGIQDTPSSGKPNKRPKTHLGWYLFQLLMVVTFLEWESRRIPVFALARSGEFEKLGPRLGAAAVLHTLFVMWCKFTLLWRVARGWALADGIDPPENMRRALVNHYSIVEFWKTWHSSFNRWLVAYIYVPVGGRDRRVTATFLVFCFVAYWHDVSPALIAWGLLNAGFIALEVLVSKWTRQWATSTGVINNAFLYRSICAFGGATCIVCMMSVNMIGYAVGVNGASAYLERASTDVAALQAEALNTVLWSFLTLYCTCHLMFEFRRLDGTFDKKEDRKVADSG